MNARILSQLQHAIQYPSGHLDPRARFAIGGPVFEMDQPMATEPSPATEPATPGQPADTPISAVDAIRRFVTAGRAIFTLQGQDSRYTYRVNRAEPTCKACKSDLPIGARKCPACDAVQQYPASVAYFVALLTGPDNLDDYTYAGLLNLQTGTIRITRSSKYTDDSKPIRAFNWAIGRIWRGLPIAPATFYHIGRCARCGRALTVPSSIESGLGPECAGKLEGI